MSDLQTEYYIALFNSVSHVLGAEKILIEAQISHKIIPVPKSISTECGVCIRISPDQLDALKNLLGDSSGLIEIRML